MSTPRIYVIIPVHNRKETTLSCLEYLRQSGDLDRYHITVVDDASTDGTAAAIHDQYPQVTVLPGNGDLWWTGAIALGMQYACEQGADYLVWLNDDCVPEPDALSQLVDFMQQHPQTIVAPTCYRLQDDTAIAENNGARGRAGVAAQPGEVIEVDSMSGWCVAMPAAVCQSAGFPDADRFPHYSGDDMYILKATRCGFKAVLVGNVRVRLVGAVHPKLNFHNHFRPGLTPVQILQGLFWSKKSPYRLSTQFFKHLERYGFLWGTPLFLIKLVAWLGQWARLQVTAWFRPDRFKVQENG